MPTSSLVSVGRLLKANSVAAMAATLGMSPPISARDVITKASFVFLPNWDLVTANAISVDPTQNVWNAGHFEDVLPLDSNRLLLAGEHSGVWIAGTDGVSAPIPLGDAWPLVDMHRLALGPKGPSHIYAGGEESALFETTVHSLASVARLLRLTSLKTIGAKLGLQSPMKASDVIRLTQTQAPLFNWKQIQLLGRDGKPLISPGVIHQVLCVKDIEPPKLVLATHTGVLWSDIPRFGSDYRFAKALGVPEGICFAVAVASQDTGSSRHIVCSPRGDLRSPEANGVYFGTWLFGDLRMVRANHGGDIDFVRWKDAVIVSSAGNRSILYAAVSASGKGLLSLKSACLETGIPGPPFKASDLADALGLSRPTSLDAVLRKVTEIPGPNSLYAILNSRDGGASWYPAGPNQRVKDAIATLPRDPGTTQDGAWGGGRSMSLAVSNADPDMIAFGYQIGPWIGINRASGFTWEEHGDRQNEPGRDHGYSPHIHADIHGMHFNPFDPTGKSLYMCNDGGLTFTTDLRTGSLASSTPFQSYVNQRLPTLEFEQYPGGLYSGSSGASSETSGLLAGGLQDNGVVFTSVQQGLQTPWQKLADGDGMVAIILKNDLVLFTLNDGPGGGGGVAHMARWDGSRFERVEDPKVTRSSPSVPLGSTLTSPFVEPVLRPQFRDPGSQQTMIAIAAYDPGPARSLWGLFADADGGNPGWVFLTVVGLDSGDSISAAASDDGRYVLVGSQKGRIFSYDVTTNVLAEMPVDSSIATSMGALYQFAFLAGEVRVGRCGSLVVRYAPAAKRWSAIEGNGLPSSEGSLKFMAVDTKGEPTILYLATDYGIHASWDAGANWLPVSQGLPRRSYPSTLRCVAEASGKRLLYLFTYGRSAWRAELH